MAFSLSEKSLAKLKGVHPDLQAVVKAAIKVTDVDFTVLEGVRTIERQKQLVAQGASQTMNSRHITGHAVDLGAIIDGDVHWHWPLYDSVYKAMQSAADKLGIEIVWGGSWKSFKDGPHFELNRKFYP